MITCQYTITSIQMNYFSLSQNQKKVLETIINYFRVNCRYPTNREIQKLSGLSPRGVTLQLNSLESQNYIVRSSGARGISLNQSLLQVSQSENVSIDLINAKEEKESNIEIPIMASSISAGLGNFVDDYASNQMNIPLSSTKGMRNVFAVKVFGDSMIGAGIESGDIAIIAPQSIANSGDIVAAIYDGGVTLKKFLIIDGRPILMPANPKYEPITNNFSIQGKLINLIKNNN